MADPINPAGGEQLSQASVLEMSATVGLLSQMGTYLAQIAQNPFASGTALYAIGTGVDRIRDSWDRAKQSQESYNRTSNDTLSIFRQYPKETAAMVGLLGGILLKMNELSVRASRIKIELASAFSLSTLPGGTKSIVEPWDLVLLKMQAASRYGKEFADQYGQTMMSVMERINKEGTIKQPGQVDMFISNLTKLQMLTKENVGQTIEYLANSMGNVGVNAEVASEWLKDVYNTMQRGNVNISNTGMAMDSIIQNTRKMREELGISGAANLQQGPQAYMSLTKGGATQPAAQSILDIVNKIYSDQNFRGGFAAVANKLGTGTSIGNARPADSDYKNVAIEVARVLAHAPANFNNDTNLMTTLRRSIGDQGISAISGTRGFNAGVAGTATGMPGFDQMVRGSVSMYTQEIDASNAELRDTFDNMATKTEKLINSLEEFGARKLGPGGQAAIGGDVAGIAGIGVDIAGIVMAVLVHKKLGDISTTIGKVGSGSFGGMGTPSNPMYVVMSGSSPIGGTTPGGLVGPDGRPISSGSTVSGGLNIPGGLTRQSFGFGKGKFGAMGSGLDLAAAGIEGAQALQSSTNRASHTADALVAGVSAFLPGIGQLVGLTNEAIKMATGTSIGTIGEEIGHGLYHLFREMGGGEHRGEQGQQNTVITLNVDPALQATIVDGATQNVVRLIKQKPHAYGE